MKTLKTILASMITAIILIFTYFIGYTFIEPISYDFMTKYVVTKKLPFDNHKNIDGHKDIVLIVVDNKTIEKYRWPWKREKWCKIYNYLYEYGKPKVIAHDGLIAALDTQNPESDKKFFDTIAKSDIVIQAFAPNFVNWENKNDGLKYEKLFIKKYRTDATTNNIKLPSIYNSMLKIPEQNIKALKHAGSTRMMASFITGNLSAYARGGKFRNYEYFINYHKQILPSFALGAFMIANNDPKMVITKNYVEFPELNYKIKHKITKYQSIVPLKFYNTNHNGFSHKVFSAADIISSYDEIKNGKKPLISPNEFNNKIVTIGVNAEGIPDIWPTPMLPFQPGIDIQATAIDNIVHNDFLKIVPDYINYLIILLGILLIHIVSKHNKIVDSYIIISLLSALYLLLTCIFYYFGIIIDTITPIIVWFVATIPIFIHKLCNIESNISEKNN